MQSGHCRIVIDGIEAGEVEYKYDARGHGLLWGEPSTLEEAWHSEEVSLVINQQQQNIIVNSVTGSHPAQFAFKTFPLS
ncbi:hypothetical protein ACFOLL_04960 [Falsochrobactrum ovis]|uniref:Uncharacterized protein n=1 Tax=Falsochrobactrum ovis TaxID=1293442 RepID=A0A364JV86_9HYPH|nr:hypothetical protein [Falsochrobactrum ovis]RAK29026.1 hypothetical protein C7374_10575 [Falsochrobactrum ovis]